METQKEGIEWEGKFQNLQAMEGRCRRSSCSRHRLLAADQLAALSPALSHDETVSICLSLLTCAIGILFLPLCVLPAPVLAHSLHRWADKLPVA